MVLLVITIKAMSEKSSVIDPWPLVCNPKATLPSLGKWVRSDVWSIGFSLGNSLRKASEVK